MHFRTTFALALMFTLSASLPAAESPLGHYKKLGKDTYLLVLQPGAKVMESLVRLQRAERFPSASVTGVGVFRNTTLGFYKFNPDGSPGKTHTDRTVKGAREVVSLSCVLTSRVVAEGKADSEAPPHCHVALAGSERSEEDREEGFPVVGGHLIEAEVGVTAELVVTTYPTAVIKRPSAEFGGILIDVTEPEGGKPLLK